MSTATSSSSASASANTSCSAATTWIWRWPIRCRRSWRPKASRWTPGSSSRWSHAAARAKITLFEDAGLAEAPIAVPSRGSSLFAKTISTALDRATLSQVVLDGFFARTALDDLPREARRTGLQEFGLPYASDPVISKHLARFLTRSLQNVQASDKLGALVGSRAGGPALMPTAVLFNGGVFKAEPIRARVLDLLASWNGGTAGPRAEGLRAGPRGRPGRRDLRARTAPPARACASRPARRARTISAWKPRCRPFPGSGRRSRRSASCRRACRRAPSS